MNRWLTWLLRAQVSRLVDRSLVLLSVTGRRSGRVYTFPVQYAPARRCAVDLRRRWCRETWWRNLTSRTPVQVLLRRAVHEGMAQAFRGRRRPQEVGEGLRDYRARYPREVRRVASEADVVMVRVDLRPDSPPAEATP